MPCRDVDLLIVGAGPAGLLASCIASSIGLSHAVVERRGGTHVHPSAHVVKPHSMEVYRRIGIADAIEAASTPAAYQRYVTWCESLAGLVYGRIDLEGRRGPVPRFAAVSPSCPENIPQSVLEPLLLARARALADTDPVFFNHGLTGFVADDAGVTAEIDTGSGPQRLRCQYLIGADGAASRVRGSAGIAMTGPAVIADFIAINIESDVRDILDRNPGVLFFVRQPGLNGAFIMHQPVGQQVFMLRFDPAVTPYEGYGADHCMDILRRAFGADRQFELTGVGRWAMSAQVADRYRRGRVFLVGDAAHRFPPTGGLGLNTGVEDVENLIWKLGAVLRGQAGDGLLDSYERECRPIALRNTAQSVENNARTVEVEHALGAASGETAFARALAAMKNGDPEGRLPRVRRAVCDQLKHFSHLELEMATPVDGGASIAPERPIARPCAVLEDFEPSFTPGKPMPHFWLAPGVSTIDVLEFDRFVLFVPADALAQWTEAAGAPGSRTLPVKVVPLARDATNGATTVADFWGGDPYAVLVRPDGRIAWVEPPSIGDRPGVLAAAIRTITSQTNSLAKAITA